MAHWMPRRPEPELMDIPQEAAAYAAADFAAVNEAFVTRLLDAAGNFPCADAVDLGTGPGDIPLRLLSARPKWRITAVDGARAMIELATAAAAAHGARDRIRLVLGDASRTGLAGGSFDVVFSNSLLHHVRDPAELWAEVNRLARPGGLVFLRDLARPADEAAARATVEAYAAGGSALLREEFFRSLLSAYTSSEVRGQLDGAGLSSLAVVMSSDRHLDVIGRLPGQGGAAGATTGSGSD